MILFHGTIEENVKKIKKNGILDNTQDQWILEVTNQNVCCVSHQPSSGEGGNASYFAYRNPKIKNQNGYLVVIEIPDDVYKDKIITIFDNKILDDYVQFHFFIREEFSNIGHELFKNLAEYQKRDHSFSKLDEKITKRKGNKHDHLLTSPKDQRLYNKQSRTDERYMYKILEVEVTDEFFNFAKSLGQWSQFYQFLHLHFSNINEEYQEFCKNSPSQLDQYWKQFYSSFPISIKDPRHEHFKDWFSPSWLTKRQLTKESNNCQILMNTIEPKYILGFIKITTPSGFAGIFRSSRSQGGFSNLVWKEVNKLWE